ncbi:N-acetylglucosamine-6-phosphate deacetylase [Cohnella fermenti]|uniref:N-acetylglucosamine-6-phosphate deacetylase n=1 Tax=Cohnella fermenti TaxID=2565925 RepID=A0A4S4CAK1_9BACL|nr:amidohydrolase family protein [Cohnella fermenti]THF84468.1 N-acetylglucosamine-6-phosphate deacetylase [Cohnella fermenti]
MSGNNEAPAELTLIGRHYASGEPVEVGISGEKIAYVRERNNEGEESPGKEGRTSFGAGADDGVDDSLSFIGPGLVDLQINGYRGRDFNLPPLRPGLTDETTRLLYGEGVTGYCPTVITNRPESIEQAMRAIARDCREGRDAARSVAGIHLEGPFLSPEDGARGAHSAADIRAPDWELFRRWQDAAEGRIRILTMSPEWPNSADFIERCSDSGVIVSIGHTAASSEQIADAAAAGARLSTHLGNGAHLQLPRHPNYIWEQLAQDGLSSCVIADGFHLPDQVLKVVLKVKADKALLVSDAVALSGMPPGRYETAVGGQVTLTPEGKLHLADNERLLAGSAQMLSRGIERLFSRGLASFADAWEMASVRPAALLGLEAAAGLTPGAPADIAVFRRAETGRLTAEATCVRGELAYHRAERE